VYRRRDVESLHMLVIEQHGLASLLSLSYPLRVAKRIQTHSVLSIRTAL
jgi:hypothetical protein